MITVQKSIFIILCLLLITFSGYSQKISYQGEMGMSYNMGLGSFSTHIINIHTVHGININPYLMTGIGVGVNFYVDHEELYYDEIEDEYYTPYAFIPLFLNVKTYILDRNTSPFFSIDTGYNIGIEDFQGKGNFYFTPSLGIHFARYQEVGGLISIGYEVPKIVKDVITGSSRTIIFKLGFVF